MSAVKEEIRLEMPRSLVEGLLDHMEMDRNSLFSAWLWPEQSQGAAAWWDDLQPDKKDGYKDLLQAVAAPVLLATFTMLENDTTVLLRCLVPSTEPGTHVYLIREQESTLVAQRLEHRDEAVDAIWELLSGDFPVWEMEWGARLSKEALYTLLAITDLQQRKEFVGLLEHSVLGWELFCSEVEQIVERAFEHSDIRWLLPFFLTVNPDAPELSQLKNGVKGALKALCEAGLLESSKQNVYRWSPQGEFLAGHWCRRLATAGLQVLAADHHGTPVFSHAGFIRSPRFLWFLELGSAEEELVVSTPPVDLFKELLDELLSPLGEPRSRARKPDREPDGQVLFCPYCGGKLAVADARFCNACGKALKI